MRCGEVREVVSSGNEGSASKISASGELVEAKGNYGK